VLEIARVVGGLLTLINMLVAVWCILSWFPNIKWYEQPFKTLDQIVHPILAPFRKIIPPIGTIDISPIVAMVVVNMIGNGILTLLNSAF
jgi:YggT family protein